MLYRVVSPFIDLKDGNRFYDVGDFYPATNIKLSKTRIDELENGKNRFGKKFIEKITDFGENEKSEE